MRYGDGLSEIQEEVNYNVATAVLKFCPVCRRTHRFIEGRDTCSPRRYIKFDLALETSRSATRVIDIAREVARTEGNRLPEGA